MVARAGNYRPIYLREQRILPVTSCRLFTLLGLWQMLSLGEQTTNASGKLFGKQALEDIAARLRRRASVHRGESVSSASGYNRDNAIAAWRDVFPRHADYLERVNHRPLAIKAALRQGYAYSISGQVNSKTPALRRFVNNVPHEIGLLDINDAGTQVLVLEPMTPEDIGLRWVSWSEIKEFSRRFAFDGGRRVALRIKIGHATKAAILTRQSDAEIRRLRRVKRETEQALDSIAQQLTEANASATELLADLQATEGLLEEAIADTLDNEEAREAGFTEAVGVIDDFLADIVAERNGP